MWLMNVDDVGMQRSHRLVDRSGQPREGKIWLARKKPTGNGVESAAHRYMPAPMNDDTFWLAVCDSRMAAFGLNAHPRVRALAQKFFMQTQCGMIEPARAIVRKHVYHPHGMD